MGTALTGPVLTSATTGCSPVTDIPNPNATGGIAEWIFASAQTSGLGNNCAAGGCIMNFKVQPWQAPHAYTVGQEILDTNLNIQVCRTAGTSRTAAQGHPTGTNHRWEHERQHGALDQPGPQSSFPPGLAAQQRVRRGAGDSRQQRQCAMGCARGNIESWRASRCGMRPSPVTPTTVLPIPSVENGGLQSPLLALPPLEAPAGLSWITSSTGTLAGASQVYFSTLSNQTCTNIRYTGGCAVQASQSALQ
jgi:hypothetical protein